jgi:methylmalonyl-CoA mutase N-terminal domain/subunit
MQSTLNRLVQWEREVSNLLAGDLQSRLLPGSLPAACSYRGIRTIRMVAGFVSAIRTDRRFYIYLQCAQTTIAKANDIAMIATAAGHPNGAHTNRGISALAIIRSIFPSFLLAAVSRLVNHILS